MHEDILSLLPDLRLDLDDPQFQQVARWYVSMKICANPPSEQDIREFAYFLVRPRKQVPDSFAVTWPLFAREALINALNAER